VSAIKLLDKMEIYWVLQAAVCFMLGVLSTILVPPRLSFKDQLDRLTKSEILKLMERPTENRSKKSSPSTPDSKPNPNPAPLENLTTPVPNNFKNCSCLASQSNHSQPLTTSPRPLPSADNSPTISSKNYPNFRSQMPLNVPEDDQQLFRKKSSTAKLNYNSEILNRNSIKKILKGDRAVSSLIVPTSLIDGKFLVEDLDLGYDDWERSSEIEGVVGVGDLVGGGKCNDDDLMFMGFDEVSEYLDVQIEQDPGLKEIFFVDKTERVRNLIIVDKREIEGHLSRFKHAKGGNLSLDRTNLVKPKNFSKTPEPDNLPSETKKRKLSSWTLGAGKFQSFEGTFYDESKAGPDVGTPNFNRTINSRECCFYNLHESPEKGCLGFESSLVENLSEIKSNKHSITDKSTILYEGPFEKNYVENPGFEFGCDSPEENVGLTNEQCSAKERAYKNLLIRYVNKNLSMVHLWGLILLNAIVRRPTIDLARKNLDRGSQENLNYR
jgi:hypothetical protein